MIFHVSAPLSLQTLRKNDLHFIQFYEFWWSNLIQFGIQVDTVFFQYPPCYKKYDKGVR